MKDKLWYYKTFRVAKTQLQMEDDNYYALLERAGAGEKAGKISATTMKIMQMEKALGDFKRLGFKVKAQRKDKTSKPRQKLMNLDNQTQERKVLTDKLHAMWSDMFHAGIIRDPSETACHKWLLKRAKIAAIKWLDTSKAHNCIEALKLWGQREGLDWDEGNGVFIIHKTTNEINKEKS